VTILLSVNEMQWNKSDQFGSGLFDLHSLPSIKLFFETEKNVVS
jgi:hypothetical protein